MLQDLCVFALKCDFTAEFIQLYHILTPLAPSINIPFFYAIAQTALPSDADTDADADADADVDADADEDDFVVPVRARSHEIHSQRHSALMRQLHAKRNSVATVRPVFNETRTPSTQGLYASHAPDRDRDRDRDRDHDGLETLSLGEPAVAVAGEVLDRSQSTHNNELDECVYELCEPRSVLVVSHCDACQFQSGSPVVLPGDESPLPCPNCASPLAHEIKIIHHPHSARARDSLDSNADARTYKLIRPPL